VTAHYIAFEGAEGSGKSTQAARLAEHLHAVLTRETGGTEVGTRLREILHDTDVSNLAARAEALMTAADRAQHIAEIVKPALDAGRSVVSDRSVYSAIAYQGYGRELDVDEVNLDRFEAAGPAFHQRVIDGFRTMAADDPDRWITVSAVGSIDKVATAIRDALGGRGIL